MAKGVNKVFLLGHLGAQPEVRHVGGDRALTELRLATNRRYKDRDGNWTDATDWHSVVVWGRDAENCGQYLTKGSQVFVEGRLQTRSWEGQDGQRHYRTEVVALNVQFLGGRGADFGGGRGYGSGGGRGGSGDGGHGGGRDGGWSRDDEQGRQDRGDRGGAASTAAPGSVDRGGDDPDDIPF